MKSEKDMDYKSYLSCMNYQLRFILFYSVPWVGFIISTFAKIAFMKCRRRRRTLHRLRYAIVIIFQWYHLLAKYAAH